MAEIYHLKKIDTENKDIEKILKDFTDNQKDLKRILVIGETKDGERFYHTSVHNINEMIADLEVAKHMILTEFVYLTEDEE